MKSEFTARNKNEWLMCDSIFLTLIEFSAAIIHHKNIVEYNEKKKIILFVSSMVFTTLPLDSDNNGNDKIIFPATNNMTYCVLSHKQSQFLYCATNGSANKWVLGRILIDVWNR